MTDRRLIVMRHAKAEPFASTDHGRRLTERGVADAHQAGAHLARAGFVPDHAVVSTAERTRMTWSAVREGSGSAGSATYADELFHGDAEDALVVLHGLSPDLGCVVVVGHNPTAAELCHLVDDGEGDPDALGGMLHGFPPTALAVFEVAESWSDLGPETGRIVDFFVSGS